MKIEVKFGKGEEKRSDDYMIAEFDALYDRANLHREMISNKINFFLAVTTAIIGGIIISENSVLEPVILPVSIITLIFLFVVGWVTFLQVLDLLSSSIYFYRRAGRIRKWFLDNDPTLLDYTPFTVCDDLPKYYSPHANLRGVETILLLLNAAIIAIVGVLSTWLIVEWFDLGKFDLSSWLPHVINLSIGLPVFFIAWRYQVWTARKFLEAQEKREKELGRIHFPKKKE